MKKVYTHAAVTATADGFGITLDGRPLRTPAGRHLVVPRASLAASIVGEWASQDEVVVPDTMPMTQLASTTLDRIIPNRQAIIDQLINYGSTDLLCYRADSPRDLTERQESVWQPLVDWVSVGLGAELVVTSGVVPIAQPEASLAALRRIIEAYDDFRLAALQSAVAAMGSLILGVALVEGRIDADEAYEASQLDETYQIEFWGEDAEARARRERLHRDVSAAARFLEFCIS